VKFQAETADRTFKSGEQRIQAISRPNQTKWLLCNFELEIDGLNLKRVNKIDGFTVKQNVKQMTCGPEWMYQIEPTSLEFPNLTFYTSMIDAPDIFDWHKDFVVNGNNGPGQERAGSIVMKTNDLAGELFEVELKSLGVVNVSVEKQETGRDQVSRVKVELYCEEMAFTLK
jgi:hypothetical protein